MENKTSVNSSSIIDLKAELFRKQEEFKQQKLQNSQSGFAKAKSAEKKPTIWSKTNSGVLERAQKDLEAKVEEENVFENSKRSLEAKAKLYKQMTEGTDIPEEDGSQVYLVDFQKKVIDDIVETREKKRQQEEEDLLKREEELLTNAVVPPPKSEGEEWVDYVDALGRSRRCMKKDLPYLKRQDERLGIKESKQEDRSQNLTPELLSNDMRREMLRQKWEEEEKAAMNQPIHYSNVQFDEIRTHGVGFYQFDKKESGRQEQMETLSNLRQKTKEERDLKERIKEKRKAILDARLAKVKQRKLKREGKETFGTDFHQEIDEEDDDDNVIGPKIEEKVDDKEEEIKETMEKQFPKRENQPKKIVPVREWDKGKERLFPAKSEEKYFQNRRDERVAEFAPPSAYYDNGCGTSRNVNDYQANTDRTNRKHVYSTVPPPTTNQNSRSHSSQSHGVSHENSITEFLSQQKLKSEKHIEKPKGDNKNDISTLTSNFGDISSIPLPKQTMPEESSKSVPKVNPSTHFQPPTGMSNYPGTYDYTAATVVPYPCTNFPVDPTYYNTSVSGQLSNTVGNIYPPPSTYGVSTVPVVTVSENTSTVESNKAPVIVPPTQAPAKVPVTRYNIIDPRLIQNEEALETTPDNFTPIQPKNS